LKDMNATFRNILLLVAAIVLIGGALSLVNLKQAKQLDIGTFVSDVQDGKVKEVVVDGSKLEVTLTDNSTTEVAKESDESLSTMLKNYGVDASKMRGIKITIKQQGGAPRIGRA